MRRVLSFALLALCAAAPARAQVDELTLKSWGGTYLSDCAKPSSPRISVLENSIVYIEGDKKVTSTNATSAPSWFGMNQPENYVTTFLGDMKDGDQMIVVIYQTKDETWATVEGGGTVQKALGKTAMARKYPRCVPTPSSPKAAPVETKAEAGAAPALPGAAEYAVDPVFAAPYKKALGKYANEPWLKALEGPSPDTKKATIAGTEYVVIQACKAHDCADNNTTLLWNADKKVVYGKVRLAGKSALIGNPPKEVQKDLGDLWWKTWGQSSP